MNLIAQKLWALVSLEVVKLLHFKGAVFLQTQCHHDIVVTVLSIFFFFIIGQIVMKNCGHM